MTTRLPWIFALLGASCVTGESIVVRDDGELLVAGRARKTATLSGSERHHVAIGAELGGYGTNGSYSSPSGARDYKFTTGYATFVGDFGFEGLRILPKAGIGITDFAVDGQTTTVRGDGLGFVTGLETRYGFCSHLDVYGRATSFLRSSLESEMFEVGIGFRPLEHLGIELGYGRASIEAEADFGLIPATTNNADVTVDGVLLSVTLEF